MKTLKFSENLIPLILKKEKTTTWRLFDDKNLKEGDELIFLNSKTGEQFAKALVAKAEQKTFGELTEKDKQGHEEFRNDEELYKTYSDYYKTKVIPSTSVKVIKFKMLK